MGAVFIRTLILYTIVLIAIRLMGKREVGQLQPFELVITIMIADLASVPMQNIGIPLIQGIIPILALLVGQLILSFLNLKSKIVRSIITGRPTVLIENGKIMEEKIRNQKYTIEGLMEELRVAGYPNIKDVDFAILEVSGEISVIPKQKSVPPTREEMNIKCDNIGIQIPVIIDGQCVDSNIQELGISQTVVDNILKDNKVKAKDVFVLLMDKYGSIYLQRKKGEG